MATKKARTKNIFSPPLLLLLLDPGSEIRDPRWIKIRIRNKHSGSATLDLSLYVPLSSFSFSDLRGHPVGGADEGVPLLIVLPVLGGHAKVRNLDTALRGEEHIPRLQVPVDDAVPVQVRQAPAQNKKIKFHTKKKLKVDLRNPYEPAKKVKYRKNLVFRIRIMMDPHSLCSPGSGSGSRSN